MDIRLVKHEEIDKTKWNSCVHYASTGNVLGYKWYIDNVAKTFDALVEGEYESVLPLVEKQTFLKNKMLYQPKLLQGLGIYSIHILSSSRIKTILEAIPKDYQKIDLQLNEGVKLPEDTDFSSSIAYNHQLLLNTSYEVVEEKYATEVHTQLALARENKLVLTNIKPERVAEFYQKYTTDRDNREEQFHAYQRIMYNALHRGWGFASGVESQDGELLVAAFFIFSHGRLMRLLSHCSPKGAKMGANTLLFDMLIRTNIQRPLLLDFRSTHTNLPFDQFGAKKVPVFQIQRHHKKWGLF